ncbi:MAG TPA: hypothetical protein V6D47_02755 [Oscillatoriaceae cyanobacterium]
MQPVRMKAELETDLEGIRQMLLGLGPRLEPRQPGITDQIRMANLSQPLLMMSPSGETVTVVFEPQAARPQPESPLTIVKVEVRPPGKPLGKLRAGFWRWRTRFVVKMALKRAKLSAARRPTTQVEVLPPE